MNVSTKITINGREYNSIDEMPPEVLAIYEQSMNMLADRNGNGIPDILEGGNVKISGGENFNVVSAVSRKFTVNGKTVERFEDLPAEVQQKFRDVGIPARPIAPQRARQFPAVTPTREGLSGMTLFLAFICAAAVTAGVAWLLLHR